MKKQMQKILLMAGAVTLTVVFVGQGCGKVKSSRSGEASSLSLTSSGNALPKDFVAKPVTQTVSMAYSRQILDSWLSCSGVGLADDKIKAEYENRKGSLSEFGYATQISSPMMMSIVAVAGEVCNKLILTESSAAVSDRRIFPNIDFSKPFDDLRRPQVEETVRRLARSCWQRESNEDEVDVIVSNLEGAFAGNAQTGSMKNSMLMLCTGMLSSMSAISM